MRINRKPASAQYRLISRRQLLQWAAAGAVLPPALLERAPAQSALQHAQVFVGKVGQYDAAGIVAAIEAGFRELGIAAETLKGRRVLLKPNLVESVRGAEHINTHPVFIGAAVEVFRRADCAEVLIAEGPGHRRDTLQILDECGMADILHEQKIRFVDINYEEGFATTNRGNKTRMDKLILPRILQQTDLVVSLPKLKTHHWVGATLAMKNLFGLMPGIYYGWPKNKLHIAGLNESIVDINATVGGQLAIVDGIVGMEGDGPIMGRPKAAGLIALGRNFPAVDATCSRLMGIDPHKLHYLALADQWLGPIAAPLIEQRGEHLAALRQDFALIDFIPAHQNIRLQAD